MASQYTGEINRERPWGRLLRKNKDLWKTVIKSPWWPLKCYIYSMKNNLLIIVYMNIILLIEPDIVQGCVSLWWCIIRARLTINGETSEYFIIRTKQNWCWKGNNQLFKEFKEQTLNIMQIIFGSFQKKVSSMTHSLIIIITLQKRMNRLNPGRMQLKQ